MRGLHFRIFLSLSFAVSASSFAVEIKSEIDPRLSFESLEQAPLYWGSELIGADLAKKVIASKNLPKISVVVSDSGVFYGAKQEITYDTRSPFERGPFRLLSHTEVGKNLTRKTSSPIEIQDLIEYINDLITEVKDVRDQLVDPTENFDHGAHVSGLIGADQSEFGSSNLVEIEDLNVFQGFSSLKISNLFSALFTLITRPEPTPVLNMSHGLGRSAKVVKALHELVERKDTVCVIAALNYGSDISQNSSLSQIQDCVIVGALGLDGVKLDISNYGNPISLVAPGEQIFSFAKQFTYRNKSFGYMTGTSMAAPLISGVAANIRALLPHATAENIRTLLYGSAIDLGKDGRDEIYGFGVVNALKAAHIAIKLRNEKDLRQALNDPKTYNFSDLARKANFAAVKSGASSPAFLRLKREEALLKGTAESFSSLGRLYEKNNYTRYGRGLQIMAGNRPNSHLNAQQIKLFSDILSASQEKTAKEKMANISTVLSIVQPELAIATFKKLSMMTAALASDHIKNQLVGHPVLLLEFNRIILEKLGGFDSSLEPASDAPPLTIPLMMGSP